MAHRYDFLTGRHRRATRSGAGLILTAREAVRDRARLGRPSRTGDAFSSVAVAEYRYEPTMSMFNELRWASCDIWHSAFGGGDHRSRLLTASMVIAIIDAGLLCALDKIVAGEHEPSLYFAPMWVSGSKTELGAEHDAGLPGLNVRDWQSALDIQFHRSYCKLHG